MNRFDLRQIGVKDAWTGESDQIIPTEVVVQRDWVFHNPITTRDLEYTKGEVVVVSLFVPACKNEPFGFPFFWGDNGKPYPAWLVELREVEK
ncbi:hypothetical protein SEA_PUREGLOBE5_55 [Arthrobacter phage Pureglobe5]|nr:hypothetical protein SEA_PUREGLOBE5_55 [Arthrobacter phage Pureglobe5]